MRFREKSAIFIKMLHFLILASKITEKALFAPQNAKSMISDFFAKTWTETQVTTQESQVTPQIPYFFIPKNSLFGGKGGEGGVSVLPSSPSDSLSFFN